jgi:hypothetical protein
VWPGALARDNGLHWLGRQSRQIPLSVIPKREPSLRGERESRDLAFYRFRTETSTPRMLK